MIVKIDDKRKKQLGIQKLSYLILLILVAAIYFGIIAWRPIIGYYYIKDAAKDAAKPGYFKNKSDYVPTENEVRTAILQTADEWKIPLKSYQIRMNRTKENITVTVDYTWTFNVPGYKYDYRFRFTEVGEQVRH
jgi:hypothetical protein